MTEKIDELDMKIISLLRKDGRMPNTELAKKLKISETSVRRRINRLKNNDVMQIVAIVHREKLGEHIRGNIKINVDSKKTETIIRGLNKINGIWYIAHITGAADFDIEFSLKNHTELRDLLAAINKIEGVIKTETSFRLELIKNRLDWDTPKS